MRQVVVVIPSAFTLGNLFFAAPEAGVQRWRRPVEKIPTG